MKGSVGSLKVHQAFGLSFGNSLHFLYSVDSFGRQVNGLKKRDLVSLYFEVIVSINQSGEDTQSDRDGIDLASTRVILGTENGVRDLGTGGPYVHYCRHAGIFF